MYRSDKWQVGQMTHFMNRSDKRHILCTGRTNVGVDKCRGRTNVRLDKCRSDKRWSDKRWSDKSRVTNVLFMYRSDKRRIFSLRLDKCRCVLGSDKCRGRTIGQTSVGQTSVGQKSRHPFEDYSGVHLPFCITLFRHGKFINLLKLVLIAVSIKSGLAVLKSAQAGLNDCNFCLDSDIYNMKTAKAGLVNYNLKY